MKAFVFCVCLSACISFISTENIKVHLQRAVDQREDDIGACAEELNLQPADVFTEPDIINKEHLKLEAQEKRKKTGCMVECVLKKYGLMEGTEIKEEKIQSEISNQMNNSMEPQAHKIAHKCIREAKDITEECGKGFKMMECVSKAIHKYMQHEDHESEAENDNER